MPDGLERTRDALRQRYSAMLEELSQMARTVPETADTVAGIRRQLEEADQIARQYRQEREAFEDEAYRYPTESHDRIRAELHQAHQAQLGEALADADALFHVLEAQLHQQALPRLTADPRQQQLLRDEARMLMEAAGTPEQAISQLATSNRRDLAALAVSSWGRSWLASRGVDDPDATHRIATLQAVEASAQHGDEAQQTAAQALTRVGQLRALPVAQRQLARADTGDTEL